MRINVVVDGVGHYGHQEDEADLHETMIIPPSPIHRTPALQKSYNSRQYFHY